jgi:hypothetical protein
MKEEGRKEGDLLTTLVIGTAALAVWFEEEKEEREMLLPPGGGSSWLRRATKVWFEERREDRVGLAWVALRWVENKIEVEVVLEIGDAQWEVGWNVEDEWCVETVVGTGSVAQRKEITSFGCWVWPPAEARVWSDFWTAGRVWSDFWMAGRVWSDFWTAGRVWFGSWTAGQVRVGFLTAGRLWFEFLTAGPLWFGFRTKGRRKGGKVIVGGRLEEERDRRCWKEEMRKRLLGVSGKTMVWPVEVGDLMIATAVEEVGLITMLWSKAWDGLKVIPLICYPV